MLDWNKFIVLTGKFKLPNNDERNYIYKLWKSKPIM